MTELAHRISPGNLSREQVELVKRTIAKEASDDELALFIHQCNRTGLDPFAGQIYWTKRAGVGRTEVTIGGARLVAERRGGYRPGTTYFYDGEGQESKVWLRRDEPPAAARVTVFKDGAEVPGIPVNWSERAVYKRGGELMETWERMPATMLAKCAEMATLRQAFPQELSGLYSAEEMAGAGGPPVVATPPAPAYRVGEEMASEGQVEALKTAQKRWLQGKDEKEADRWQARLMERYRTTDFAELRRAEADELLQALKGAE